MEHLDDDAADAATRLPRSVRLLQWLVIGLTASMIVGVITVVALVVIRFPKPPTPPLPETLVLPEGEIAGAVTQGTDWVAVVTRSGLILIYDRRTGALRQTLRPEIASTSAQDTAP